jgi:hypothetical protein
VLERQSTKQRVTRERDHRERCEHEKSR